MIPQKPIYTANQRVNFVGTTQTMETVEDHFRNHPYASRMDRSKPACDVGNISTYAQGYAPMNTLRIGLPSLSYGQDNAGHWLAVQDGDEIWFVRRRVMELLY